MQPLKAQVRNGRLVLDEPTDLPEGEVIELWPAEVIGDMDDEERAALNAELEASEQEYAAGMVVSGEEFLASLRAGR